MGLGGSLPWAKRRGDGGTSTFQNPVHAYTQIDILAARLTIYSEGGADQTSMAITATNPVMAAFSADPLSGVLPLSVAFSDQSTTSSGTITSRLWDFGDTGTSTLRNPVHPYTQAGSYTVSLTASNGTYSDGETKQDYITVQDLPTTTITYTYDDLYRLTDAVYSSGEHFNYTYDAVGNRLTEDSLAGPVDYDYDIAREASRSEAEGQPAHQRGGCHLHLGR